MRYKFTDREINILRDVIHSATHGLGLGVKDSDYGELGKVDFSKNYYEIIKEKFFSYLDHGEVDASIKLWAKFLKAYRDSCQKLDPREMETITGYGWEETQELTKKIEKLLLKDKQKQPI